MLKSQHRVVVVVVVIDDDDNNDDEEEDDDDDNNDDAYTAALVTPVVAVKRTGLGRARRLLVRARPSGPSLS